MAASAARYPTHRGPRMPTLRDTEAEVEALVVRVCRGDEDAWQPLWELLAPMIDRAACTPRVVGRLAANDDDRRNIVLEVMARLRDDGFRRLHVYLASKETHTDLRFGQWLTVVARRIAIDYVRAHDEYVDRRRRSAGDAWIVPGTLPPSSRLGGARPPITRRCLAVEMLRYASDVLSADQRSVLELWIHGVGHAEIARMHDVEVEHAERLVRSALMRLRKHFRDARGEPSHD